MSRRLGGVGFAALIVATVAAFFITQHLKVSDPLIAGARVVPADINPQSGRTCLLAGKPTNYRHSRISFFLPDHSDTVGVLIVNSAGERVRTLAWRHLNVGQRGHFTWNGRESNGRLAPDGTYYVQIALQGEGRSFDLAESIRVIRTMPRVTLSPVRVVATGSGVQGTTTSTTATGSAPSSSLAATIAAGFRAGATVLTPGKGLLEIRFHSRPTRGGNVLIYRTTAAGGKRLVDSYSIPDGVQHASWDGKIHGTPAPPGTYTIGIEATDRACNVGTFPAPGRHSAAAFAGAGVTVSYVSASAPLTPVAAGSKATVSVVAPDTGGSYDWTLRRAGSSRTLAGATGSADRQVQTTLPGSGAGLYVFGVHAGGEAASVPLVAAGSQQPVLVVLPALTWQGENAVDETGNGFPDTLAGGDSVALIRPLVSGLPAGFIDTAEFLRYLERKHMRFQLTTDIALAQGIGPQIAGHRGVLMLGSFRWLPTGLAQKLHAYVEGGGHLVAIGTNSLLGAAKLSFASDAAGVGTASPRAAMKLDPFGLGRGATASASGVSLQVLSDPLDLLGRLRSAGSTAGSVLTDLTDYQALVPPADTSFSVAGSSTGRYAIVGIELGHGTVLEAAVDGLGRTVARSKASQNLVGSLWQLLKG